jgi:hypothetical protein
MTNVDRPTLIERVGNLGIPGAGCNPALLHAARTLLGLMEPYPPANGSGAPQDGCTALNALEGVRITASELGSVFDSLCLQREQVLGKRDRLDRLDENTLTWDVTRPWVDLRARELSGDQGRQSPTGLRRSARFSVVVAHDVDRTSAREPTALLNAILKLTGIRTASCLGLAQAWSPRALVRNVERLLDFEREQGIGAHYFMLAGPYRFGRYSTRTDIRWSSAREIARLTRAAGMRLGLHGSFHARDRNSYREEKDRLEQAIGGAITTHRNHYLRFDPVKLYAQLEEAGIRFDFSVGFVTRIGFRNGCGHCHRAFDLQNQRPASVYSVPQLFMDTVLQHRDPPEVLSELRAALLEVQKVRGCVCLVFHPETFLMDGRAWPFFEQTIRMCQAMGADLSGRLPEVSGPAASGARLAASLVRRASSL